MILLTPQQNLFVKHYLAGHDAETAADLAGYKGANLRKLAAELLRKPHISALVVGEVRVEVMDDEPITNAEWILERYRDVADFDIAAVTTFDGRELKWRPYKDWPTGASRAVMAAKVTESRNGDIVTEFRFRDSLSALDKLGQYLGIWQSFDQLVSGLKAYGIELERDGDKFKIKETD